MIKFLCQYIIVYHENAWNSKQMITEGEPATLLETTRHAFGNQSQSKQRSTLVRNEILPATSKYILEESVGHIVHYNLENNATFYKILTKQNSHDTQREFLEPIFS